MKNTKSTKESWYYADGTAVGRKINGKYYIYALGKEVSIGTQDRSEAIKIYETYKADPEAWVKARATKKAYRIQGVPFPEPKPDLPITMTDALIDGWVNQAKARNLNLEYIKDHLSYLKQWQKHLQYHDLRLVDAMFLQNVIETSPTITGRTPGNATKQHRESSIKAFYSYLVRVGVIKPEQDPTFRRLTVRASRRSTVERSISKATYEATLSQMDGIYRDTLILMANTGYHFPELLSWCQSGQLEPSNQLDKPWVLTIFHHKRKTEPHRIAVTQTVADAAQRLRGQQPEYWLFSAALHLACDTAQVPRFSPGALRHTFARYAYEQGADIGYVATSLGHKNPTTTSIYTNFAVPKSVPTFN